MNTKNAEKAKILADDVLKGIEGLSAELEATIREKLLSRLSPEKVAQTVSPETLAILETVLTEVKAKGYRAVIIDAVKGIKVVGSRKGGGGARPGNYVLTKDGKTFEVEGGKLRAFLKTSGLEAEFWAKYPKRDREASLSARAMVESIGWTVEAT